MSDFVVTPADGKTHLSTTLSVHVYTFGDDGAVDGDFCYLDDFVIEDNLLECDPGWYTTESVKKENPVSASNAIINFGRGVSILSDCGAKITCAGEVLQEAFPISIVSKDDGGNTYTGNCSPVDLNLEDFAILPASGKTHLSTTLSVHVYTFGDDGSVDGDFCYLDAWVIEDNLLECDPGWYTTESVKKENPVSAGKVEIKSGRMISILSDCGAILTIPSAL